MEYLLLVGYRSLCSRLGGFEPATLALGWVRYLPNADFFNQPWGWPERSWTSGKKGMDQANQAMQAMTIIIAPKAKSMLATGA